MYTLSNYLLTSVDANGGVKAVEAGCIRLPDSLVAAATRTSSNADQGHGQTDLGDTSLLLDTEISRIRSRPAVVTKTWGLIFIIGDGARKLPHLPGGGDKHSPADGCAQGLFAIKSSTGEFIGMNQLPDQAFLENFLTHYEASQ